MKAVIQQESTGCAIATAAAIAGVSYEKAKVVANHLGIYAEDKKLWSDTAHVRKLLEALGIEACQEEKPFVDWQSLPDCALLSIKWYLQGNKPYWHWVVFVREGSDQYILDSKKSLKKNVRRDFGRIKPKWYIEVFNKF